MKMVEGRDAIEMHLAAFESAGEAIVITDLSGCVQYANPVFEKISGYRRDEVIGLNPRILKSGKHPASYYERLWQTITSGNVWKGSFLNRRKDGTIYRSEQTIAPMLDKGGQRIGYVSVHEDVSERVRFEESRREVELQYVRDEADERVRLARHELELARQVQARLFPQAPMKLPGIDLMGAAFPAEETCGDYYDFIPLPNHQLGVVLGDVSGHGLGPALVMAETRAYLRALSQSIGDVGEILSRLNQFLVSDLETGRFVSLFLAILDPNSQSLTYSAGGQPAYHFSASGNVTRLDNSGMVLGLLDDAVFPPGERISLLPGDLILVATDGLHETHASDGTMLGMERVFEIVRASQQEESRTIIEELYAAACRFREDAPQQDDITVVILKRPGSC